MEERLDNGRGREERGERGLVNYYQKMRIKNNEASKRARLKRRIKQVGQRFLLWIRGDFSGSGTIKVFCLSLYHVNHVKKEKTESDPGPKVPDPGLKHWFGLPGLNPSVIDTGKQ
jgi:hypothetical protein